jgi:hypothetical protein
MGKVVKSVAKVVSAPVAGILGGVLGGQGDRAKQDFDAQLASLDPGVAPEKINYEGITDNKTGELLDRYKLSGGEGYTKIAQDRLKQDIGSARNRIALQAAQAQANQRAQLASRGGLTPAMQARLAMQAQRDAMGNQQDVTSQDVSGQQGIMEKQFELGREGEKENLASRKADQLARNQFNVAKYGQQMQAYAAGKAGQASYAASRGKGEKGGVMGGVGSVLGK